MQMLRTAPVFAVCMIGACATGDFAGEPRTKPNGGAGGAPSISNDAATAARGGATLAGLGGMNTAGRGVALGGTSAMGGHATASQGSSGGSAKGTGGANAAVARGGAPGAGGASAASGRGGAVASGGAYSVVGRGGALGAGGASSVVGRGGASGASGPTTSGSTPVLPAVSGECPNFATGNVTVGGIPIMLKVGAKKEGTGSLIFYWHGTGSSPLIELGFMFPTAVINEVLAEGGIIAAFNGTTGTGGDCSGTMIFSKDDFKIADQIAACAVQNYNIDPRRIYSTGCSAGGLQSGCMAVLRSSYLAAAVPNSGGLVFQQPLQDAKHVPALMTMHGGASDVVVVSFSQTSATCDAAMKTAGGFVVNCNHGGGHCGAPAALYAAGWEFMKAHPFGVSPDPYASGLPSDFPTSCKIY